MAAYLLGIRCLHLYLIDSWTWFYFKDICFPAIGFLLKLHNNKITKDESISLFSFFFLRWRSISSLLCVILLPASDVLKNLWIYSIDDPLFGFSTEQNYVIHQTTMWEISYERINFEKLLTNIYCYNLAIFKTTFCGLSFLMG